MGAVPCLSKEYIVTDIKTATPARRRGHGWRDAVAWVEVAAPDVPIDRRVVQPLDPEDGRAARPGDALDELEAGVGGQDRRRPRPALT